jgi:hypothetical protein
MDQATTSIYADLKFWSFIVAAIALALSQLPPLNILFRRARLGVEVYSQIFITHKYGNPNTQFHLIVSNTGGRKVRVKGIALRVSPATGEEFSISAGTYHQKQSDTEALLFTPFSLLPGEEWAHLINFWNPLTRQDDKRIRESTFALRTNINEKLETLDEAQKNKTLVFADENLVAPFIQIFERQFKWHPDEYEIALSADTEPPNAIADQRFRFVLFESDTVEMRKIANEYATGAGIYFAPTFSEGVIVPIQKINPVK